MAQTILSEKQSTGGSPYAFYTVEVTPSGRTANSVNLAVKVKSHLQYSSSYRGTGVTITAYLTINGTNYSIPLKLSSATNTGFGALFLSTASASKDITFSAGVKGKWK